VFVSEPIEVEKSSIDNTLLRFTWREQQKNIVDVLAVWQDWGFPAGVHKANWRMRHHRNYYRVKCDDDKTYEIYLDRQSAADQKWFLYRILE
jgi:hypothetical protein